ncbi:helix-turn-helix domain-containing protein [Bifidobacterium stellenboschense]|uniref:Regulator of polyketide synthase expression n=1 Tax=Bifidobacterium stellenboschense TaxID=762211 RepID=A0A087DP33_9BIFI|nr:helix-turn-helix domain-containing protein [Bifidobacterium stellenboschense]KFI97283.1 regulator of polyketide synthase expression [Bifidobacterium stellenboschense]
MTDFLDLLTSAAEADDDDGSARARMERVTFESLTSGLSDDRVASLLRVLGFDGGFACFAIAGRPAATVEATMRGVTKAVVDLGGGLPLVGVRDGVVAALIRVEAAVSPDVTCTAVAGAFDATATPLCLGPVRHGVSGAKSTLIAALTTLCAAPALVVGHGTDVTAADAAASGAAGTAGAVASGMTAAGTAGGRKSVAAAGARNGGKTRGAAAGNVGDAGTAAGSSAMTTLARKRMLTPLRAEDALPERALLGDDDARRELVDVVYGSLVSHGADDPTMMTVSTFLSSGGSLETTARTLNVHPNTVRYRLKRAADTTGWDATNPREAYVLTTAIALGRINAK